MFKLLKNSCSTIPTNNGLFGWNIETLQNNTVIVSSPFVENTIWQYNSDFSIMGHRDGPCVGFFGYTMSSSGNDIVITSKDCNSVSVYQSNWYNFGLEFEDVQMCGSYVTVLSNGSLRIFKINEGVLVPVDYSPIVAKYLVCDVHANIYTLGSELTLFTVSLDKLVRSASVSISGNINAVINDAYLVIQYNDKIALHDKASLKKRETIPISGQHISTSRDGQFLSISDPDKPLVTILSRNLPGQSFSEESRFLKPKDGIPYYTLEQLYGTANTGFGKSMAFTDKQFFTSYPLGNCFNIYSISSPCIFV
eukprot:NODE_208_length_14728_cov_0.400164.p4 type:complete len:308 gc:universal NODE_208_length_14728_cov_0.400164:12707-11784(-)